LKSQRCEFHGDKMEVRLDRTISGEIQSIEPLVVELLEFVSEMECAAGNEFAIETALREALANAVLHGCDCDPSKQVQVVIACEEDRGVLIVVRDPGPGFDPSNIPSPVIGENIFPDHGRGIYLINQLMDDVEYDLGGAEIRMVKR